MIDLQAPTAPTPARGGSPEESVIGADLAVRGGLEARGRLNLSGEVFGDVKVERLTLSETASLEGSVEAVLVEVRGRVVGTIKAKDVRLYPTARVEADITYETLVVEAGAKLDGRCFPGLARRS
jgi:cytoskeletal protein CcmA (bactofilin family)